MKEGRTKYNKLKDELAKIRGTKESNNFEDVVTKKMQTNNDITASKPGKTKNTKASVAIMPDNSDDDDLVSWDE